MDTFSIRKMALVDTVAIEEFEVSQYNPISEHLKNVHKQSYKISSRTE